jgi:hypothetical protein
VIARFAIAKRGDPGSIAKVLKMMKRDI